MISDFLRILLPAGTYLGSVYLLLVVVEKFSQKTIGFE